VPQTSYAAYAAMHGRKSELTGCLAAAITGSPRLHRDGSATIRITLFEGANPSGEERQRRGIIVAWGEAPGKPKEKEEEGLKARSTPYTRPVAMYRGIRRRKRRCRSRPDEPGFQPLRSWRLQTPGPLAQPTIDRGFAPS